MTQSQPRRDLQLLLKISRILDQSEDLRDALEPVLGALARLGDMRRGMLTLLDQRSKEVYIDAAYGLSEAERRRGRYQLGEGITGRVVKTGQAVALRRLSESEEFLDRTGAGDAVDMESAGFVCVPITVGSEVIGALSAIRDFQDDNEPDAYMQLLTIVASMVAQAVQLRQILSEEGRALVEENARLQQELRSRFQPDNLIGRAKTMRLVYDLIAQVSGSGANVLLQGESGVGKELVANAIHYNSRRARRPFIRVNCGALSDNLLESELFGHEKGAFTGATSRRAGRFELADGGTIFLDEIGDFSQPSQVALLRVLQEREFERVGGQETVKVDVRVIAATSRDLPALMREGTFREDLYYRLNVFPINVPPLRERKTDIPHLVDFFIEKYSGAVGRKVRRISTPAIDMLLKYHWPGNVRELENCIERAVLLTTDDVIRAHHLPPTLQTADGSGTTHSGTLEVALATLERELIVDALKNERGNMAAAARALGVSERIIGLRAKKHGLDWRSFRL